jgi:hypothetical protein
VGGVLWRDRSKGVLFDQQALAERHFDEALRIHESLDAPFFIAETKLALGRLQTRGRSAQSRHHLTAAAEISTRYGYARLRKLAIEALAQ